MRFSIFDLQGWVAGVPPVPRLGSHGTGQLVLQYSSYWRLVAHSVSVALYYFPGIQNIVSSASSLRSDAHPSTSGWLP